MEVSNLPRHPLVLQLMVLDPLRPTTRRSHSTPPRTPRTPAVAAISSAAPRARHIIRAFERAATSPMRGPALRAAAATRASMRAATHSACACASDVRRAAAP